MNDAEEWTEAKPRRKKPVTLGHRTLSWLRDHEYLATSIEQTIRYPDREHPGRMKVFKRDAWGVADIICCDRRRRYLGTIYIQVSTIDHQAERIAKITGIPAAYSILESGNHIWVMAWAKKGPRGKRKLWQLSITEMVLDPNRIMRAERRAVQELEETGEAVETLFSE